MKNNKDVLIIIRDNTLSNKQSFQILKDHIAVTDLLIFDDF